MEMHTDLGTVDLSVPPARTALVQASECTLAECAIGEEGTVLGIESSNPILRNKLLTMGVIRNTMLRVTQVAPLGDPINILVRGFTLSLRRSEARCVRFARRG